MSAINIAASGMKVMQEVTQTAAHNLSNAKSFGFKEMMVQTTDLPYQTVASPGAIVNAEATEKPAGVQYGHGSKVNGTHRILTNGDLKVTNQPFHAAIMGSGYFGVLLSNNRTGYTRNGAFQINRNRTITNNKGEIIADNITIPEEVNISTIDISEDGLVTGIENGNTTERVEIGRLTLYTFNNEDGLIAQGNSTFLETEASGEATPNAPTEDGAGKLVHKSVEMSNVEMMDQVMAVIEANRTYDALSKVLNAAEDMQKTLTKS